VTRDRGGGELLDRIVALRKRFAGELGIKVPPVTLKDSLEIPGGDYRVLVNGVVVAQGSIMTDRLLAMDPGNAGGKVNGIATKDPAFGLEALWIEPAYKDQAQTLGYTVVDSSTVIATHLNTLLHKHAHELLGHEEVHELLTMLGKTSKKLAEDLPSMVNTNILLRVLQNLLIEDVPIRDMRTIAEALAAASVRSQDPGVLTAAARVALSRVIVQNIYGAAPELAVLTLDPPLEQILLKAVQQSAQQNQQQGALAGEDGMVIEPAMAERLQRSLLNAARNQEVAGKPAVLLVPAPLRPVLSKFVRFTITGLKVLSYQEIPDNKQITIVATVGQ
jgi:flagellar biosynthesis protein FlhA